VVTSRRGSSGSAATLLDILRGDQGSVSDLLRAAKLAGDVTVIDDELVDALLSIRLGS
jgi:hypothetical protein